MSAPDNAPVPAAWLRVVRGSPDDDELAALAAVVGMLLAGPPGDRADGTGTVAATAARAHAVRRRTGRAAPGREPWRAPIVRRPTRRADEWPRRTSTDTGSAGRARRAG